MSKKGLLSLFLLSLLSLIFVSCSNFMEGKEFLDELQNVINYNSKSFVKITIDAPNSYTESISPAVGEYSDKYKCGDSFTLSYIPNEDYNFLNWVVEPEGAVTFEDVNSAVTQVTILAECEVKISPNCSKKLMVVGSTPSITSGAVNRTSNINIYFNYSVAPESIYYTKDELIKVINDSGYTQNSSDKWTNPNEPNAVVTYDSRIIDGEIFYSGYTINKTDGENEIKIRFFKNIEIKSSDGSNLNIYYDVPYLEDNGMTLVIPVYGTAETEATELLPKNTHIVFAINDFFSVLGSKLNEQFSASYKTNTIFDVAPPEVVIYKTADGAITGTQTKLTQVYGRREYSKVQQDKKEWLLEDIDSDVTKDLYNVNMNTPSDLDGYHIYDTKSLIIRDPLYITDDSALDCFEVTLTPLPNKFYPNQSNNDIIVTVPIKNGLGNSYKSEYVFDLSSIETEGIFKFSICVKDILGYFKNMDVTNPYIIMDNIFSGEIDVIKNGENNYVIGPAGKYYLILIESSKKKVDFGKASLVYKKLEETYSNKCKVLQKACSEPDTISYKNKIVPINYSSSSNVSGKKIPGMTVLIAEDEFGNVSWKQIR